MTMDKNTCSPKKMINLEQYEKLLNEYMEKHNLNIEMVNIDDNGIIHFNNIEYDDIKK